MRVNATILGLCAALVATSAAVAQESLADLLDDPATHLARPADRDRVVRRMAEIEATRRHNAHTRATLLGLPLRSVTSNGRLQELVDFEGPRPRYLTTYNVNAAISTGANLLRTAPYELSGAGVTIGLWDGGAARATHQEFGGRVVVMDGAVTFDHATHVGGTLLAAGVVAAAHGMAAAATINSYDWNNDTSEMTSRGATAAGDPSKIYISNHSYGTISGWNQVTGGTPARSWEWYGLGTSASAIETDFGMYNTNARTVDSLAFNAPYYLIFRAAGNDRLDNPAVGDSVALSPGSSTVVTYNPAIHPAGDGNYRGGFDTIGFEAVAKNVMTVGSVSDAVTNGVRDVTKAGVSSFSCWGPTDDGRIKPDVVANGEGLYSSLGSSDTAYGIYSGTSMATPNAVGSAALLIQQYGNLFPGQAMHASTLKGLLIHTADDLGNPGPDYKYGWGLVNVQAAADLIQEHKDLPVKQRLTENQLTSSTVTRTQVFVWDGVSPISATLCWTDPAAATLTTSDSRSARLVNDLDLKIIAPDGSEFLPFVMPFVGTWTQAAMDLPATTGVNKTDNVEQVRIAAPPVAGVYQVVVSFSGTLSNNIQNYSLFISGSSVQPPPPPAPPANLIAKPGNNTVSLAWDAAVGATGYKVKRALTSGGPYITLGDTLATSYTDTAVIDGTVYYYVLSASNFGGDGADSSEVGVTPLAVPSTTTITSSSGSGGQYGAAVTFTATVSVTGGPATGTVTFADGAIVIGSGTLNAAGQASYTTTALAVGGHAFSASYAGNATFAASAATGFDYTVTPKVVTITGVSASTKVYDGTTADNLTGGTLTGVLNGENVTVVAGSGAFASPAAGSQAVTATGYALGGTDAGNYVLVSQPVVANAMITPRSVMVAGSRVYDATATAAAEILAVANNLDGTDLTITGSAKLTGRDVGTREIAINPPARRVQSAIGNTGSNAKTSFSIALGTPPLAGNTLVAVISTRGTSSNRVSAITQTGASWSRVAQATNTSGSTTTEIWFAPNVAAGAAAAVTISQASLRSAAVVMEYYGVLAANQVDQTANSTGSSNAPVTGTTVTTSQADELWVGGIGYNSSSPTMGTIRNGFSAVASTQSSNSSSSRNAKCYALECIVSANGTASTGGTLSASAQWAGALATFRSVIPTTLSLTGSAAGNYTLTGVSGAVEIRPLPVTVTAVSANKTYDGTTLAAGTPTLSPALAAGDTIGILRQEFQDSVVGFGNKVIIPSITINDGNGGANYALTVVNNNTGTISPASAILTIDSLTQTYDGSPKAVSVSTVPAGLAVSISYDNSVTPPSQPGSYAVTAAVIDPDYVGAATGALVIASPVLDWAAWCDSHFTPLEQSAGLADPDADDDGDSLSNFVEYALGTDPRALTPPVVAQRDADGLSLTFSHPANLPGVNYAAESSPDLQNWTPVPLELLDSGPPEVWRARDPLTNGDSSRRFLRLLIERK